MRRGWLRRNRLTTTLRHRIPLCGEGCGFGFRSCPSPRAPPAGTPSCRARKSKAHFFGEVSERRPWALKRADRPAAFAGRSESRFFVLLPLGYQSCLHGRVSYPISHILRRHPPLGRPKRKRKITLTTSGKTILRRYTHDLRQGMPTGAAQSVRADLRAGVR